MKKLYLLICFASITPIINAQQWLGGLSSTSDIYRTGNVGIGISSAPSYNLVVNHPTAGNGARALIGDTSLLTSGLTSDQTILEIQNLSSGNGAFFNMFSGSGTGKVGLFFSCTSTYGTSITAGRTGLASYQDLSVPRRVLASI